MKSTPVIPPLARVLSAYLFLWACLFLSPCLFLWATPALADRPDTGFFIGGAARVGLIDGTGTWQYTDRDGVDWPINFSLDAPMSEGGNAMGFNWEEKILIGMTPSIGYYLNETLSLQLRLGWNFPKSSSQSYTETNGQSVIHREGFNAEWKQRSTQLVMGFHRASDFAYYLYGGISLVQVDHKITIYEGNEYNFGFDFTHFDGSSQVFNDDFNTLGILLGIGFEFPTPGDNRVIFASAQYESARTDETFHGTDDFRVEIGGFSALLGIKWFPWAD